MRYVYLCFFSILSLTLFMSNENGRADGQNWGNTGAPGDQTTASGAPRTCVSCHSGPIQVTLDIELKDANGALQTSYIPGDIYDVTVKVNHVGGNNPNGYGYQIVSLFDGTNADVNAWSAPDANVKIATASNTGRSYAEHDGISSTGEFTVKWTAPATGSGDITFYSSGNGINGNGQNSQDGAALNTLAVTEEIVNHQTQVLFEDFMVSPNPVVDHANLNFFSNDQSTVVFTVLDLQGKMVWNQVQEVLSGDNQIRIPMSDLPKGQYLLSAMDEKNGKKSTLSLIKE